MVNKKAVIFIAESRLNENNTAKDWNLTTDFIDKALLKYMLNLTEKQKACWTWFIIRKTATNLTTRTKMDKHYN